MLNQNKNSWGAVWAMTLGISSVMIAEFLPVGLLTPMAKDLAVSEGFAGQTITITSIFAVLTSLTISYATRKVGRKNLLISLSALVAISSAIVSLSPNLVILLFGRGLLGISLGGIWSMAAALATRLVTKDNLPKALSIIFGGASFSTMLAAPLGSFLGQYMHWRTIFLIDSLIAITSMIWLFYSMPILAANSKVKFKTIFKTLSRPSVKVGLLAVALTFCGRFATITYMRPYLENTIGLNVKGISLVFFLFDAAYFMGTFIAAEIVKRSLVFALSAFPFLLALASLALAFNETSAIEAGVLIFLLGISFAPIPVGWSTWGTKIAPDDTESIGGLYVASVQTAAGIGAFAGGILYDKSGSFAVFSMSSLFWFVSAILTFLFVKTVFNKKEDEVVENVIA
ncbi:MFS transporter [Halobacteriovorax sp. HFRX-2_2]|uniref:MFS transporter n=1 Tax=unclassified Halobacteriovorax TaxID=2639665 RepID=UPI0037152D48